MFLLQFVWIITVTVLGQFWCSWHWEFWADRNKELHSFLGSPHVWVIFSDQCHCFAEPAYCYDVQLLCHNRCEYWCCEDLKISACIYMLVISWHNERHEMLTEVPILCLNCDFFHSQYWGNFTSRKTKSRLTGAYLWHWNWIKVYSCNFKNKDKTWIFSNTAIKAWNFRLK